MEWTQAQEEAEKYLLLQNTHKTSQDVKYKIAVHFVDGHTGIFSADSKQESFDAIREFLQNGVKSYGDDKEVNYYPPHRINNCEVKEWDKSQERSGDKLN